MADYVKEAWADPNSTIAWNPKAGSDTFVENTCVMAGKWPVGWIDWTSLTRTEMQSQAIRHNNKVRQMAMVPVVSTEQPKTWENQPWVGIDMAKQAEINCAIDKSSEQTYNLGNELRETYQQWVVRIDKINQEKKRYQPVSNHQLEQINNELEQTKLELQSAKAEIAVLKQVNKYNEMTKNDIMNMLDIQKLPGNASANEYMRGLANGLILALNSFRRNSGKPELELVLYPYEDKALTRKRF
jgi:hypothetical protein